MPPAEPLYRQIAGALTDAILSGKLPPGERLRPVRELAVLYGVNVNTAQRALRELRQAGLLVKHRGALCASEDANLLLKLRRQKADSLVRECLHKMEAIGYTRADILCLIRDMADHGSPAARAPD